jgi:hypothetical protein
MNSVIHITLDASPELASRLDRLREEFAKACNAIAPIAQVNHCWNRVALHHLTYRQMREAFPDLGSQMVCNAIYSVCRSYRLLLTHPQSPFFGQKIPEGGLPQIFFLNHSPVFFDRHTLSLQNNVLSMFTLEGRLRFGIGLSEQDELRFRTEKLREIQLHSQGSQYLMMLFFDATQETFNSAELGTWPDYMVLKDQPLKNGLQNEEAINPSVPIVQMREAS